MYFSIANLSRRTCLNPLSSLLNRIRRDFSQQVEEEDGGEEEGEVALIDGYISDYILVLVCSF